MILRDSRFEIPLLAEAGPLLGPLAGELVGPQRGPALPRPRFLVWCEAARVGDEARVGARTVGLGEMRDALVRRGLLIPDGFATSADAVELFLDAPVPATVWKDVRGGLPRPERYPPPPRTLRTVVRRLLHDPERSPGLTERSRLIRSLVRATDVPAVVRDAIQVGYRRLRDVHGRDCEVAVRCSRADDDGTSPFFGHPGEYAVGLTRFDDVVSAWRDRCAAAFEEGAVRAAARDGAPLPGKGFGMLIVTMARSDIAASGFVSTRDPVTRSTATLHISASPGVGAAVEPAALNGDALVVAKDAIRRGSSPEERSAGPGDGLLDTGELTRLAEVAVAVEDQYGCPVRVEWAQDGRTGEFMVVQVNPLDVGPGSAGDGPSTTPALEPW